MAQVSYGTITITDTNDIEKIYMEYAQSTSNQTAPTSGWDTDIPTWQQGKYIWQRTVTKMSGVDLSSDSYGEPVCLTGSTGSTGAAGRSVSSIVTTYCNYGDGTPADNYIGWQSTVPAYDSTNPNYWVKTVITYSNPTKTSTTKYKDNGITSATSTAAAANSVAQAANQTANTANNTANNANTKADNAVTSVNNLQNKLKYYWVNEVAHTNGVSGWTKPNYPAGTYAASGISGTTFDSENSSTYGYNTWYANGINLRYNAIKLGELTGSALTFYQPSTTSQGAKAMELSGSALKFYASNGTTVQAEFGGSKARVSGTINAYDGQIGNSEDNYWYIGNYLDYFENQSAIIKSHGTASIQLGDSNTWRIATNRIHTAWNNDSSSGDAFKLHFPVYDNKYWDSGLHLPTSANDKLLYIRNSSSSNTLTYLNEALEDQYTNRWNYLFYITNSGSIYAKNIYVLDDNGQATQIGGTDGVYLLKSGGTITGNLTVNGTLTGTLSGTATRVSKDLKIQLNGGTTEGTNQFTYNGSAAKTINITKSSIGLSNVENTALSTWAGSANLTTTKVGTLAAAAAKGVDTSLTTSTTSTNLPTSAAVVNLIKQYLPLTGGNVTGAVSFGSSVSADELTAGDLVVNGAASFTNNLQANTINGVAVGSSPKFTDTVTTVTVTGNGNAVTAITASNGKLTVTKGTTFLTSYTETDPIFVASAAHGITSNDISNWNSKTSNTGTVTSVRVQASSPLTSTTSTASNTTLDTTIKFSNQNKNLVLAGPSSGDAAAPTFRSLVAADIPGLAWSKITSGKPTTLSGYGITDAVPSSRKVAGHALTSDVTISNSDVGLGNVINAKQITNITNEFKDGQNTGKLVIWRGESDSEVLEVQITAREATSATNATNAQYATYDASEASKTTKTTIANKYIAKSVGTKKGDIIYWSGSGTPVRLEAGTNGQVLKLANGVPTWGTDNNDNTWRAIQVNGTDILGTGTSTGKLNLKAGSNVTITNDSGTVTIASSYTNTDTKVNMKARGTTKAYLLGTTTAPTSSNQAVESVAETGVYFDTTAAKLVATTFSGALTGNASSATEFSSNATVTLTGDTTGTSAGSKKSWSIATTNSYITSLGRAASADYLTPSYLSKVHFCLASSSMTTHKPPAGDGYITTYHWDNNGWAAQFYLRHNKDNPAPMVRGATSTDNTSDWGEWKYILTEVNYTDYTVKKDGTGASGNWGINVTGTASNVTGTVAIGHGGTGLTASPSMLTNLGSTTAANVLQASPRPGITGTLGIGNGGTGQTSAKNAANAFLNALDTGSSTPVDADYYISQYVSGGTTTTTYHRRPMSALWNYISGKISSSGTYVTIATDQTITANQKTFNGAIRWGTSSKYGAAHYDSTLDALVFSFA